MLPIRKVVGALVSTTLVSAMATVAVTAGPAAPAHADQPNAATSVQFSSARLLGVFGSYLSLPDGAVTVTYSDGTTATPRAGTAVLQRQVRGSTTWQEAGRDESLSFLYFPGVDQFRGDMAYRVYYTGGTYTDSTYGTVTAAPSVSVVTPVATLLDVDVTGVTRFGRLFAAFSVLPRARYKVLVQIKRDGQWRFYARTVTSTRGKVQVRISRTSFRGVPYRAIFNGGARFTDTKLSFRGIRR